MALLMDLVPPPPAEPAEPAVADVCCLCLEGLVIGDGNLQPSVVCKNIHTVCQDCMPSLYASATMNRRYGGGFCPLCKDPLLKINADHPFRDSLPAEFRATVDRLSMVRDERVAKRMQSRMDRVDRHHNVVAVGFGTPAVERRKKRSMAQVSDDIARLNETDPAEYRHRTAKRIYKRERSVRSTRAWRCRQRVAQSMGLDYERDYLYQLHKRISVEWNGRNIFPPKAFFQGESSLDVFTANFYAEQRNNIRAELAIKAHLRTMSDAGQLDVSD